MASAARGTAKLDYLPYVDGLRAVAILMVVVYHAWPHTLPGGFIGVDVFFVISGFLITRIIADEMANGEFSFMRFLSRRIRRLAPASIVMLAAVLLAGAVLLRPDTLKSLGHAIAFTCGLLANVYFYRTGGYFSAPPDEKPILHMWSLAVEDQFYLTWPLLLLVLSIFLTRRWIILVVIALSALSLMHAQLKLASNPDYAFYMLPARAWELLIGCLLALSTTSNVLKGKTASIVAWTGIALILASAVLLSASVPFPGVAAIPAVIGTAAVIAAGLRSTSVVTRALSTSPVVFIGLISYSLYLWHWPVFSLARYTLARPLSGAETAAALALSVVVATASWRYVERPFRRPSNPAQENHWRTIAIGSGLLASIFVVGALFKGLDGLPARFDGPTQQIYADISSGNPLRPFCDGTDRIVGTDNVCAFGRNFKPGDSFDVAVFGDSNADHFVPAIAKWAKANSLLARQVTQSACALLLNSQRSGQWPAEARECRDYRRAAISFIDHQPKLKLAILGGDWRSYLGVKDSPDIAMKELTNVTWQGSQDNGVKGFEIALGRTVDYLLARGIKVHIMAQVPNFDVLPTTCIVKAVIAGRDPRGCGMPRKRYDAMQGPINEALQRIAASRRGVSVSFPAQLICDEAYCTPYVGGSFLYRNANHLSYAGALKMSTVLNLPQIKGSQTSEPQQLPSAVLANPAIQPGSSNAN